MTMDRHGRKSDFDFEGAEEMWAWMTPEERRAMRERTADGVPPGAVAVVDGELPGGAAVLVIRDPASPTPRLLVVSGAAMDDVALFLGSAVLGEDEERVPEPAG